MYAGAIVSVKKNKTDRCDEHPNRENEEIIKIYDLVEDVSTMNREQTMQVLREVGKNAETFEKLTEQQKAIGMHRYGLPFGGYTGNFRRVKYIKLQMKIKGVSCQ